MSDLISRQAVIGVLAAMQVLCPSKAALIQNSKIWQQIKDLPSAQPERKKGEWISQDFNKHNGMISTTAYYYPKCSVCGHSANYTNFCPNCGADMRGGQDETD